MGPKSGIPWIQFILNFFFIQFLYLLANLTLTLQKVKVIVLLSFFCFRNDSYGVGGAIFFYFILKKSACKIYAWANLFWIICYGNFFPPSAFKKINLKNLILEVKKYALLVISIFLCACYFFFSPQILI